MPEENGYKIDFNKWSNPKAPLIESSTYHGNAPDFGSSKFDDPNMSNMLLDNGEYRYIRGEKQSWADKAANGTMRLAGRALTSGAEGILTPFVGTFQAIKDHKLSSFYDNSVTRGLDEIDKSFKENLPLYDTHSSEEAKGIDKLLYANTLFGDIFDGIGYSLGSIATGGVYTKLAKVLAKSAITGTNAAKIANDIAKLENTSDKIKYLDNLDKTTKLKNGIDNGTVAFIGAVAESGANARSDKDEFRKKMLEEISQNGTRTPTKSELEHIDMLAEKVGNSSFGFNLPVVMLDNWITFGKSIFGNKATDKLALKEVGKTLEKSGDIYTAAKKSSIDKILDSNYGKLEFLKPFIAEGTQEQSQFAITKGVNDYYRKRYYNPEAASFIESLAHGIEEAYGSTEGWENFMIGALSGGMFGNTTKLISEGVEGYKNPAGGYEQLALDVLNNNKSTEAYKKLIQGAVTHANIIKQQEDALEKNDIFEYENLKNDAFFNHVITKLQTGREQDLYDKLDEFKLMTPEELKSNFGTELSEANTAFYQKKNTVSFIQDRINKAKEIEKIWRIIDDRFPNTSSANKERFAYATATLNNSRERKVKLYDEVKQTLLENKNLIHNPIEFGPLYTDYINLNLEGKELYKKQLLDSSVSPLDQDIILDKLYDIDKLQKREQQYLEEYKNLLDPKVQEKLDQLDSKVSNEINNTLNTEVKKAEKLASQPKEETLKDIKEQQKRAEELSSMSLDPEDVMSVEDFEEQGSQNQNLNVDNIEAKKADIERRRQEALETTKNIGEDKLKEGRENTKKIVESLKQRYPATSVQGIIIRILEKLIDFSKYSTIVDSEYLNGRNASGQATWFGMMISQETLDGILAGKEHEVHTFIHEFIHGFTTSKISDYNIEKKGLIPGFKSKLTAKEKNAIEQLQRIFENVKRDNPKSKEYGFTNLDEFIAEAFSNSSFQYTLKNTKAEGKKSNLFSEFINAIGDLLFEQLERWAKRFNKEVPQRDTITGILEDVLAWTEELIDQNNKLAYIATNEEINAKYDAELAALENNEVINKKVERVEKKVENKENKDLNSKDGIVPDLSSRDKEAIENSLDEAINKSTEGGKQVSPQGTIVYDGDKIVNAATAIAYLAKNYQETYSNVGGITHITKSDVSDELNKDMQEPLLLSDKYYQVGEELFLEVDKAFNLILDDKTTLTYEQYKDNVDMVPIKITNKDGKTIGYLHTLEWINEKNVADVKGNIETQKAILRELRKEVWDKQKVHTKITSKSFGKLSLTKNREDKKTVQLIKAPVKFVVGKDNVLWSGLNTPLSGKQPINKKIVPGLVYMVVPTPVANTTVALPVFNTKVNDEIANTLANAVEIFFTQNKEASEQIYNQLGIDLLTNNGLREFFNLYTATNSFDQSDVNNSIGRDDKVFLDVVGNGIKYSLGGGKVRDIGNPKLWNKAEFVDTIKNAWVSVFLKHMDKPTFKYAFINDNKEVHYKESTYPEFIKEYTTTNVVEQDLGSGEYSYFVQPVINVSSDTEVFFSEKEKQFFAERDAKDIEEQARQESDDIDWDSVDLGDSDQLPSPVSNREASEIAKNSSLISGFTAARQAQIIQMMNSHVLSEVKSKGKTIGELYDGYKTFLETYKSKADKSDNPKAKALSNELQNILDNFDAFKAQSIDRLKLFNIKETPSGELSGFEDLDSNNEKTNFDDGATFQIDSKDGMSGKLKQFLSFVPSPKKNYLGLESYMPYDEVVNYLSGQLAGLDASYAGIALRLEEISNSATWVKSAKEMLDNAPEQIKNEFVQWATKHYTGFKIVNLIQSDKEYTIKVMDSDQNSVSKLIQLKWLTNLKTSDLVKESTPGNLVINNDVRKSLVEEIKGIDKNDLGAIKNWLSKIGIDVSMDTLEAIKSNKKYDINYQFNDPNGMFKTIIDNLSKATLENDDSFESNNPLLNNSGIRKLALEEAKNSPVYFSNSFKNGEGKTIYSYSANKYFIKQFFKLKRNVNGYLNDLLKINFNSTSSWGKQLTNQNSYFSQVFDYFYLDTLKIANDGTTLANMSSREHEVTKIGLFQNQNNGSKDKGRISHFLFPTMSDKTTMTGLTALRHNSKLRMTSEGLQVGKETIDALFDIVEAEYNRIRASYNIENTVAGYNPNKFYFFEELNDNEKLWLDGGNKKTLLPLTSDIENEIKAILEKHVKQLIGTKVEHWSKLGLLKNGAFVFADKTYVADVKSNLSAEFKTNNKAITEYMAADYVINYVIANANAFQLFIGDPAQFAKKTLDATWVNIGKRLAGEIAPGLELADSKDNKYTQAFVQDSTGALRISKNFSQIEKMLGKDNAAPYKDIDSTDAQEYTTLSEHLYVLEKSGKLSSDEVKDLLEKEEAGKLSKKDLTKIFQPIKPVYVTTKLEPSLDLNRKIYIKSSSFPLVKGLSPELDKLRAQMLAQGIDRLAFETATKVGGPKNFINIFNDNGTIKDDIDFSNKMILDRDGFRLQQEVPFDETKEAINRGTQESKLLFANLLDVDGFEYAGKEMTGEELQSEYNKLNKELFENAKAELLRELEYDNGTVNIYRVQEMLVSEAESRGWSQNDIDALKIVNVDKFTQTFALPLWSSASSNRIEALLNSLVDNRVRKQKFRGKSFVLGSEEGFIGKSKDIIYTKNYNPETGLLPQRIVDGEVLPAQILISNNLRDINGKLINLSQYITDGLLDLTKIDESLLKVFGFRIPTQGLNSMTYAEVVGFLPNYMGDLVIAPKDYTKQMGSDFDIDKLYIYMYNTQKSGENLVKFNYSDSEIEALYDSVKNKNLGYANKTITEVFEDSYWMDTFEGDLESFKFEFKQRELQNKLLDIHFSVFTNPSEEVQKQILHPLGFGKLKINDKGDGLAKDVDKARNARFKANFKATRLSDTYQKEKYIKGLSGKSGTGVKSLDSVFTAISQGKDIKVGTIEDEGEKLINLTFGDSEGNLIELNDISNKNSVDGNPKLNTVAAYQSAAVDNEKEQILEKINSNDYTFDAERALAAVGFTEEYIVPLTAQDIIFEYAEEMSRMQDSLNDAFISNPEQTVLNLLRDKYIREAGFSAEVAEKLYDADYPLTQKEMWSAIENGPQYADYYKVQLQALAKFDKAREIGKQISNIQLSINTDSSGVSPSLIESNFKQEKVEQLGSNKLILNAENLLKDTINGYATENALFVANELWSGYFPYGKERVKQTFEEIQMLTGKDVLTNTARQKLFNNMKSFVYSMKDLDIADPADRQSLFFDTPTNKSLATKIKELQKTSNNPFIQRLIPEPDITGTKPSVIKYNAGAGENFDELSVYQGFTDLFVNEKTRELAQQLVEYFYLSGGIQEAIQFGKYIPIAYLTNRPFAEKLRKLNFNDENLLGIPTHKEHYYEVSNFAKQWIQHNPAQAIKLKEDLSQLKNIKRDENKNITSFETDITLGKNLLVLRTNPVTNKTAMVLPEFVTLPDKKSAKKHRLFQYVGNGKYVQIDTLGTFGYSEYNQAATNIKSLIKDNQANTVLPTAPTIDTVETSDTTVKNNQLPLERANKYGINKNIKVAIENITNSKNPFHAKLAAEILSKNLDGIKIQVVDDPNIRGSFKYSTNTLIVNPFNHFSDYELERTILHEVLHGLTGGIIRSSNRTAEQNRIVNSLTALQKALKDKIAANPEWQASYDAFVKAYEAKEGLDEIQISKNYGAMKLTEFVTMAMTDVEFQKILNDIPFTGQKTMLDRFMDLVKSLLNSLGFKINSGSVLEESVNNILELINLPQNLVESEENSNIVNIIKPGVAKLFESNPELANSVYEALGFKNKLKTFLGKELEYKDAYISANRLKDFKQYQVLDEKGNDIGSVVIEYRGDKTVILHPKLNISGKGYGKDLYKLISSKFNVEIQEWNEGGISKSDSAKAMWDSLEKEGSAKRVFDEEQGDNFRVVKYNTQITPQQKQQAQQLYSQYVDAIKPDVILPIGTSGSGKSTFIKSLPQENLVVIEPDAMRVEFTGDVNDKSKDKEIYIEAAKRAITAIKQGKQVVFDTTNLTKEKRLPFVEAIKKEIPNANIQYKLMELNPELAKQRIKAQLARGENRAAVSNETIDRHAASYKQMLQDIKNESISEYKELGSKQDIEGFKDFINNITEIDQNDQFPANNQLPELKPC